MRKFLIAFALLLCVASVSEATPRRVVVVNRQAVVVAPVRQAVVVQPVVQRVVVPQQTVIIRNGLFGRRLTIIR